jgi:hypothetical protein
MKRHAVVVLMVVLWVTSGTGMPHLLKWRACGLPLLSTLIPALLHLQMDASFT